jgi:hypothetical protein
MVYGTYNYSFHGVYKPTNITGGAPHCMYIGMEIWVDKCRLAGVRLWADYRSMGSGNNGKNVTIVW